MRFEDLRKDTMPDVVRATNISEGFLFPSSDLQNTNLKVEDLGLFATLVTLHEMVLSHEKKKLSFSLFLRTSHRGSHTYILCERM